MYQRFLFWLVAICLLFFTGPAGAAPIWIERKFIPEVSLIDETFLQHKDGAAYVVDHTPWAEFLSTYLVEGEDGINRVRYGDVTPDALAALEKYIGDLQGEQVESLDQAEQLAFWINLYNAETVRTIIHHYPVKSIRAIDGVWGEKRLNVSGIPLSLGDIEHRIIRVKFPDPRIHYALNCAAEGCPNLATEPYIRNTLADALDAAAVTFLNHSRGVRINNDKVIVSKIFGWYIEDFGGSEEAALEHIIKYARSDLSTMLRAINDIDAYRYDWSLNDASRDD